MIGMLLTGHGHFADGMMSSMHMIAGNVEYCEAVNFEETESTEQLEVKLNAAFDKFKDLDGIIVCCDLLGGSPFKSSVVLSLARKNIEIIAGANLPLLLEMSFARLNATDVTELADTLVDTARGSIVRFTMPVETVRDENLSDGI